jgi:hypothetical protein
MSIMLVASSPPLGMLVPQSSQLVWSFPRARAALSMGGGSISGRVAGDDEMLKKAWRDFWPEDLEAGSEGCGVRACSRCGCWSSCCCCCCCCCCAE